MNSWLDTNNNFGGIVYLFGFWGNGQVCLFTFISPWVISKWTNLSANSFEESSHIMKRTLVRSHSFLFGLSVNGQTCPLTLSKYTYESSHLLIAVTYYNKTDKSVGLLITFPCVFLMYKLGCTNAHIRRFTTRVVI